MDRLKVAGRAVAMALVLGTGTWASTGTALADTVPAATPLDAGWQNPAPQGAIDDAGWQ
ncbi:hypothetical protein [Streptomyces agglomeratus]|uniref:hypothetical protein n=1 Tax=Streptomyces agglomeratus TaxID=285458 RepID=UPI001428CD45|nr:hypothetical protein [Streptomyces agglomeratus]